MADSFHCSGNFFPLQIELKEKNQCIRQKTGAQNILQEIK
jgi:hypothetical protein